MSKMTSNLEENSEFLSASEQSLLLGIGKTSSKSRVVEERGRLLHCSLGFCCASLSQTASSLMLIIIITTSTAK
jgi:hypothetical protein